MTPPMCQFLRDFVVPFRCLSPLAVRLKIGRLNHLHLLLSLQLASSPPTLLPCFMWYLRRLPAAGAGVGARSLLKIGRGGVRQLQQQRRKSALQLLTMHLLHLLF